MKPKALVLLILFALACTHAPSPRTVAGVVSDDGAPLPGVTVTLKAPGAPDRTAVTDANGRYAFEGVAAGTYVVRTELQGFNTVQTTVTVPPRRDVVLQTSMRIAALTESITVTASAPLYVVDGMEIMSTMTGALPASRPFEKEHTFVEAAKERTATFSIDVDRAAYSSIRDLVTRGIKPPVQLVRIEELVNYFTYSYPRPTDGAPFSVTTEVAGCPWNTSNRLLRIGIQARDVDRFQMPPNNLVFLIDVSGSMADPDKLPLVVKGLAVLVDQLRPEDRVSVVVYAGAAGLVLPPTSGADKATILRAINNLAAGGSTAGGEGIQHAYAIARENFLEKGNNRVILATDGDFNVGISNVPELEKLIEEKRRSGVFLSVIGVGSGNRGDHVMETLADAGNGNYSFLDSEAEAEKVFRNELTGTLVTIAKDMKVQLEFDPKSVQSYRQIGYENRALATEDFENDEKDAGDLGAGHSVTALFELVPAPGARGRIGALRVRWKDPRGESSTPLVTEIVDEGRSAYEASADLQFAAAVAEMGMLLRDSPHKGTATWDDVFQLARVSLGPDLEGERQEFVKIAEVARGLR